MLNEEPHSGGAFLCLGNLGKFFLAIVSPSRAKPNPHQKTIKKARPPNGDRAFLQLIRRLKPPN